MVEVCLSFADSGLCWSSKSARNMRTHDPELLDGVLCLERLAFPMDLRSPILIDNNEEGPHPSQVSSM